MANLVEFTKKGLYCPQADIFIDPWYPVDKAVITHAHADHAIWGHQYYLAHQDSSTILKYRLGQDIRLETLAYYQTININGVSLSLYPAGHIYGSAQVRLEYQGEVWVISGDYKLEEDGFSTPFEAVKCHTFVTESTFGLPIYHWKPQMEVAQEINQWWLDNQKEGKASVIGAYSLGKSQRILHCIDQNIGPILLHGAIYNTNEALILGGAQLAHHPKLTADTDKADISKALIIAPPSALNSTWVRKLRPFSTGIASGWMHIRGMKRRRAADRGFVVSDHADWNALNLAVDASGAEKVYVTHGYTAVFSRWLREKGLESYEVETLYEGELAEMNNPDTEQD
ncbi:ligase-associated DNA damage response exonuclease [Catalinimonas niigatensis]|uniref:ligase-associated DNA damage response exonuclease n=1 Tax=Catalinimonas niigatensis TaxID=1397264 RepID=UPI0026657F9A|nr:ligase-associated DNA damage response exonuclease [Catalinimonas niigatensis]WPP50670.1 ligase-associated DNA damage response exonuclease [Catalinimonas niigatensis]